MTYRSRLGATLVFAWVFLAGLRPVAASEWQPLFNGKDLDGWYVYIQDRERNDDPNHLIQVHDGTVHGYKDAEDGSEQPQGYICTLKEYSNYRLRFQYQWGTKRFAPRAEGPRDAGVLFHAVGRDGRAFGVWPMSVECQVQENDVGDLITVDTRCTSWIAPGEPKEGEYPSYLAKDEGGKEIKNTWYISADKVRDRLEGWNDVEIEVHGDKSAAYKVNGQVNQRLADIEQPAGDDPERDGWKPLDKGRIVFQIESAEISYRNIEIMELSPEAGAEADKEPESKNEQTTAAADDSATGVDAIHLPEGFEVKVAAGPPLLLHPMMACLDDRGRLFVAESDGVNRESVEDILKVRPHKILMLEDADGDGTFDKSTVFAEGLVQPNGAQWYDGALYVSSAPYVWRFRDLDGDGKADEQTRVVGKFGFDGMSSAFHGPVLGPDGRLYWSGGQHGWKLEQALNQPWASAPSGAEGPDADLKIGWTRWTPGAFSSWPDGSDPENHGFGGIANPVETAFTEEGDAIGTISLYDYLENQRRDVVVEWTEGAVYYMKDFNYDGLVRTGKNLEPVSFVGHVAPAGIARYRGAGFGADYENNFLFAEFNTHRVDRLRVQREGSELHGQDEIFLTSTDPNSHFTDVIEDADGSLLVLNTGGWFLHGCPTSQIAKPSIYGAVYRIRRTDAPAVADPRGLKLAWDDASPAELAKRLDDARFAVRDRAIAELAKRGSEALPALRQSLPGGSPQARLNAVWALTRIDSPAARELVRPALDDQSSSVRLAALHSISVRRDELAVPALIAKLAAESLAERRSAATALGRMKIKAAAKPLLAAMRPDNDRFLDHAIIYALVAIGDDDVLAAGLADTSPAVQRAALVALDQRKSTLLTEREVAPLLDSSDAALQEAAMGVATSRPEWADEMVCRIAAWIAKKPLTSHERIALNGFVRAFWENAKNQSLVADALGNEQASAATRLLLIDAIASVETDKLPDAWIAALGRCLASGNSRVVDRAIAVVAERDLQGFDDPLVQIAAEGARPTNQRLAAAAATVRRIKSLPDGVATLLFENCREETPSVDRLAAAQAIRQAHFSPEQLKRLADLVPKAGPLELPALLTAFEGSTDAEVGAQLAKALDASSDIAGTPPDRVAALFHDYPSDVQKLAEPVIDRLNRDNASQAERLQELASTAAGGDSDRGRLIFFSSRAACSSCHRVGDQGGQVGPNLSSIGQSRSRRDLLEAIAFPSSSFVREFEPYVVVTSDGQSYTGVMSRQTSQAIYLRMADAKEVRINRNNVEELLPGKTSIMPQGLDKILSAAELGDVVSFLQSQK